MLAEPSRQQAINRQLAMNEKGYDPPMNNARLKRRQELLGLSYSDPAKFAKTDIVGEDLPISEKKYFMDMQVKDGVDGEQGGTKRDIGITKAMGVAAPVAGAAGLDRRKNPVQYDRFVGAMAEELEAFKTKNDRQMSDKEIREKAIDLLTKLTVVEPGWLPDGVSSVLPSWVPGTPTEEERTKFLVMPPRAAAAVERTLKAQGIKGATQQQMFKFYQANKEAIDKEAGL